MEEGNKSEGDVDKYAGKELDVYLVSAKNYRSVDYRKIIVIARCEAEAVEFSRMNSLIPGEDSQSEYHTWEIKVKRIPFNLGIVHYELSTD